MHKLKYNLPLLPLRGLSVFPAMVVHFDVGRAKSIAAVKQAMADDKIIFMCYQNDISEEEPKVDDLSEVGTIAKIHQILNLPDGNIRVLAEGLYRGTIGDHNDDGEYAAVEVHRLFDIPCDDECYTQALTRCIMHRVEDFLELYDRLPEDAITTMMALEEPGELADFVASTLPLKPSAKQNILEQLGVKERLEILSDCLEEEINVLGLEKDITDKTQKNIDKGQRDYILRERLKTIRGELGEDDFIGDADADIAKYRKLLKGRDIPKVTSEKLEEEFERLKRTHPASQEYGVIQNYIETVIAMPWDKKTTDNTDIKRASEILDRDHFGLKKVKDRILEYIAVRSLGGKPKSNIICLVGPPGTGKTSVVRALAEALERKYVRISLGGVKNEAEIRGHRKTYVGAMPGRIAEALRVGGSSNPLMLFDEIDKMSCDYTGDPSSAMLEVFDPEQNKNFRDNFLELPFDLSDTIFVATANTLETISSPLLDRMDVIEVESYTEEEKINIAKKYLMPKQRKAHGLTAKQLKFSAGVYPEIIKGYTREAGVRELERKFGAICRKTAKKIAEGETEEVSLTKSNLADFLGKPYYHEKQAAAEDRIGTATGLAWTGAGGDTLDIEVNAMPGNGKFELTGNLGDVMKESAKAALSFIRANCKEFDINPDFYQNTDLHIHIPEGAVPKDGPSAGITMTTAIISALSGKAVLKGVAMTGEVTLRGRVLPIGGLKEKSLAALRYGIKTIVMPKANKPDYEELPDIVKEQIKFVFASDMYDVLNTALAK